MFSITFLFMSLITIATKSIVYLGIPFPPPKGLFSPSRPIFTESTYFHRVRSHDQFEVSHWSTPCPYPTEFIPASFQ